MKIKQSDNPISQFLVSLEKACVSSLPSIFIHGGKDWTHAYWYSLYCIFNSRSVHLVLGLKMSSNFQLPERNLSPLLTHFQVFVEKENASVDFIYCE